MLFQGIEADGYRIAVPNPMNDLPAILTHYGFVPHEEDGSEFWEKPIGGDTRGF